MADPATSTVTGTTNVSRFRPLLIGIAGGSGSGKSTVAARVAEALRPASSVAFIDMDAYYRHHPELSLDDRRRLNWDHPGAVDLELLATQLETLLRGEAIEKPAYDFVNHLRRRDTERVEPADVVIADGILLFADERIRALCDVKVFVDADADVRLIRRIRRDMEVRGRPLEEILEQYLTSVRPMHMQFVEPCKRYADIIVPAGGHIADAVDMIVANLQLPLTRERP